MNILMNNKIHKIIKNFSQELFFVLDITFAKKQQFSSILLYFHSSSLSLSIFPFHLFIPRELSICENADTHKGCRSVKTIRWCNNREIER